MAYKKKVWKRMTRKRYVFLKSQENPKESFITFPTGESMTLEQYLKWHKEK